MTASPVNPARTQILTAIQNGLGRDSFDEHSIKGKAGALLLEPERVRPGLSHAALTDQFIERVSAPKYGAGFDRIDSLEVLPEIVMDLLEREALPPHISLQPIRPLIELTWQAAGFRLIDEANDQVAIGLAKWGIAETGSLVFHSGADTPVLLNFLPLLEVIVIPAARIVAHLEDYAAAARREGDPAPRNVVMVTGASGTTDIEGQLVRGAHGPRKLHVVVYDGPIDNAA